MEWFKNFKQVCCFCEFLFIAEILARRIYWWILQLLEKWNESDENRPEQKQLTR